MYVFSPAYVDKQSVVNMQVAMSVVSLKHLRMHEEIQQAPRLVDRLRVLSIQLHKKFSSPLTPRHVNDTHKEFCSFPSPPSKIHTTAPLQQLSTP